MTSAHRFPRRFVAHALAAAVMTLTASAAPHSLRASPIEIKSRAVPLDAQDPTREQVGKLRYRGGIALTSPDDRFGGFSGLWVSPDGERTLAVSDRGFLLSARLVHDAEGNLIGMTEGDLIVLAGRNGRPLTSSRENDAEALAVAPSGEFIVGFERDHRLWRYAPGDPIPKPLPSPPGLEGAPNNEGIEALTFLDDRRLLAITEGLMREGRSAGWIRSAAGSWSALSYVVEDGFVPTDAALLPSGDVVTVERYFTMRHGLAVRVRRVAKDAISPGALLKGELLAEFRQPLTIDNMEGISARRDSRGRTLIYLIADDNYSALQRTLLLMFELTERP